MIYQIEYVQECEGRWSAEGMNFPGPICYGTTAHEAVSKVVKLTPNLPESEK